MPHNPLCGWGRLPVAQQRLVNLHDRHAMLPSSSGGSLLPFGYGRSYGDVALNDGGQALLTSGLDRFIAFDCEQGILRAESGVSLDAILKLIVPRGWFLPVTPGTRFVTLGGAIANDVHGKNHHIAGTFGAHVTRFELLRSDGERRTCMPGDPWFQATVGGLGLTGLITWAEIRLQPIANAGIEFENRRFKNLDEYFEISRSNEARWPYTVAWIDCAARGTSLGRGVYFAGRHAASGTPSPKSSHSRLNVPLTPPVSLINHPVLWIFNQAYYHLPRPSRGNCDYIPFFYPLDHVGHWNRIYGPRGFYQYQFVVPMDAAREAVAEVLDRIALSGQGSFLAVLKTFGPMNPVGMLSFPRPGVTLALDFPNLGDKTTALLSNLDQVVRQANGAIYPAKDARMSPADFRQAYPAWESFSQHLDPGFSSSFWRRMMQ